MKKLFCFMILLGNPFFFFAVSGEVLNLFVHFARGPSVNGDQYYHRFR